MSSTLNKAHISLSALEHNLARVRQLVGGAKIMAVVKADAYGHGLVKTAECLSAAGADALGVMDLHEAMVLDDNKAQLPIFILAGLEERQLDEVVQKGFIPFVYDLALAAALDRAARKRDKKVRAHVKIDTGMNRLGIPYDTAQTAFEEIQALEFIDITGIASHFSESDNPDSEFNRHQMDLFDRSIETAAGVGLNASENNMANSGAVLGLPDSHYNMVRPGIMLYGESPSVRLADQADLKPVLSITSQVVQVKKLAPGSPVSYGRTWAAKSETMLATIPIGYAHGLDRRLAGEGHVLIRGRKSPIRGAVCMNLIMVDVTGIPDAVVGDQVVLLGSQGDETISASDLAGQLGTIPYEILTTLGGLNHRFYGR